MAKNGQSREQKVENIRQELHVLFMVKRDKLFLIKSEQSIKKGL